jgi:hypothetical protein
VELAPVVHDLGVLLERLAADAVPAAIRLLVEIVGIALKIRSMSSRTPALCSSAVVRMNWSWEIPSRAHIASKRLATWSTSCCGVSSAAAAAWATFWPCSSMPMRNQTSSPRSR